MIEVVLFLAFASILAIAGSLSILALIDIYRIFHDK